MPREGYMVDVIRQVAEAKCPGCMSGNCPVAHWSLRTGSVMVGCQGTGLRWPSLSRECPGVPGESTCRNGIIMMHNMMSADPPWIENIGCWTCGGSGAITVGGRNTLVVGSGRIPDVTLEKVLDLLGPTIYFSREYDDHGDYFVTQSMEHGWHSSSISYLEAACAALLATLC